MVNSGDPLHAVVTPLRSRPSAPSSGRDNPICAAITTPRLGASMGTGSAGGGGKEAAGAGAADIPHSFRNTAAAAATVLTAAGELLRVLAAPVRIAIVLQLNESPCCVHELAEAVRTPQSLVSQHLRILKAARVVASERAGRQVVYRLVDEHLASIVSAAVVHAAEDPMK